MRGSSWHGYRDHIATLLKPLGTGGWRKTHSSDSHKKCSCLAVKKIRVFFQQYILCYHFSLLLCYISQYHAIFKGQLINYFGKDNLYLVCSWCYHFCMRYNKTLACTLIVCFEWGCIYIHVVNVLYHKILGYCSNIGHQSDKDSICSGIMKA